MHIAMIAARMVEVTMTHLRLDIGTRYGKGTLYVINGHNEEDGCFNTTGPEFVSPPDLE